MNMFSRSSSSRFQRSFVAHPNRQLFRKKLAKGSERTTVINAILLALIVFSGLSYLLVVNQTSVGGYGLEELERNIELSKREYHNMKLTKMELQSLVEVEAAGQRLQMVATATITYLPAIGTVFAAK